MKSEGVELVVADGSIELDKLNKAFLEDLERVFEDKSKEFGPHLRGMLFELWNRARERPADTDEHLARLEELVKAKTEVRDLVRNEFETQLPAIGQQFRSQIEETTSSTFTATLQGALWNSSNLDTRRAFVEMLGASLRSDSEDYKLVGTGDYLELRIEGTSGSSSSMNIPELQSHENDDEFQKALQARLRREGLLPSETTYLPHNWVPVYINKESGRQAGLDFTTDDMFATHAVNTFLVTTDKGTTWTFPNPPPPHNGGWCEDVELWVDEIQQVNSNCTWTSNGSVVESVIIPGSYSGSVVRARYHTISRTLIP